MTDPDPAESVRLLGVSPFHIHLEGIKDRLQKLLGFGDGATDFPAVKRALAEVGYDGRTYVGDWFGFGYGVMAQAILALNGRQDRFGA